MTAMRNQGFTLIEILIALLILAIGLLGLAGLQSRAQQAEMESYQRAQALLMLDEMVQRVRSDSANIRSNLATAGTDCYGNTVVGTGAAAPGGCGATHLLAWHNLLLGGSEGGAGGMIGARGCIDPIAAPAGSSALVALRISVVWQGLMPTGAPAGTNCGAGAYGNENLRRAVFTDLTIADLN